MRPHADTAIGAVVAELADQAAQVDVGLGIVAAQCLCPFETGDGGGVITLRVVRIASIEMRFRRLWIERQRVLIAGQRLIVAAELVQRRTELQMCVGQFKIRANASRYCSTLFERALRLASATPKLLRASAKSGCNCSAWS